MGATCHETPCARRATPANVDRCKNINSTSRMPQHHFNYHLTFRIAAACTRSGTSPASDISFSSWSISSTTGPSSGSRACIRLERRLWSCSEVKWLRCRLVCAAAPKVWTGLSVFGPEWGHLRVRMHGRLSEYDGLSLRVRNRCSDTLGATVRRMGDSVCLPMKGGVARQLAPARPRG